MKKQYRFKYMNKQNNHHNSDKSEVKNARYDKEQTMTEPDDIQEVNPEDVEVLDASPEEDTEQTQDLEAQILRLNEELQKEKNEYLFLRAEFDNYRKRTLKEKSELIKNGGEGVLKGLLPVLDDFERGLKAAETTDNVESIKEGLAIIYKNLRTFMEKNGVKEMETQGAAFDADSHEAISAIPSPSEDMKGKIIDTVQKGYTLNDKVLRHAKVVVGQ